MVIYMTGVALVVTLGWCWIHSRHLNLIPLVLSHADGLWLFFIVSITCFTGRMLVGYSYLQS